MLINELPNEVVLAIHHILDIKKDEISDPFDDLSGNFNPAKVLNDFFPDGERSLLHKGTCIEI
jgi:hypothetical protein